MTNVKIIIISICQIIKINMNFTLIKIVQREIFRRIKKIILMTIKCINKNKILKIIFNNSINIIYETLNQ